MMLTIVRIDNGIVTCELEDGTLIDIAQRWFDNNIKENDKIEFDICNNKTDNANFVE